MSKFAKWMYELGYKNAIKDVLKTVDNIPNVKPKESDFADSRNGETMLKRLNNAMIAYQERGHFKDHIHKQHDPNYEHDIEFNEMMDMLES